MSDKAYVSSCSACGEEDVYVKDYGDRPFPTSPKRPLCFICASSEIGTMFAYPEQHIGQLSIARSIAQCTWIILRAIHGDNYQGERL